MFLMALSSFISTLISVANIYKLYDENRQDCFLLDQSPTQTELLLISPMHPVVGSYSKC